ncbi:MAG TPA: prepilin-type N-terminal cleavage/methylation domain-containing protein [Thermoanaerobaculia bacterium]|nr:prepilin-type N-terminal cleavage/methylation domain-containing protein [Thermoanaerobaculia bacterium]
MRSKAGSGQAGFTLIELLIVVAIIGIIAAMLIPNMLDAFQKAKQKRTIADMRIVGTAMFSWLTDQVGAAAAGSSSTTVNLASYGSVLRSSDLITVLVPDYLQDVPYLDGWKRPYDYYLKTATPTAPQVMAIRSPGRDGVSEGSTYTFTNFEPTDYDRDVLWADGFFVRWPQKTTS